MSRKSQKVLVRGVILDAVGTVITPRPTVSAAYRLAAERQGVALDPAVVKSRFSEHFARTESDEARGPLETDEATEVRRWRRIVHGVLPEVPDPDRAFNELWEHFGQPESWTVFGDVEPALERFEAAGVSFCMVSNFDARLRRVLEGLPALAGRVEPLTISSEVGYRKPHPEIFRVACARMGLSPVEVLSVGDDPKNDVHGARSAGLHAILLDRHDRHPEENPRSRRLTDVVDDLVTMPTEPG